MPDSSIPMEVFGGSKGMMQAGSLAPISNPLETIGQFAATINKFNEIKLFNAKFAAQQKAGQILANAPSLEAGTAELMKVPEIAMFPEIINSVLNAQNAAQDWQGKINTQANDSYTRFTAGLPGAIVDPNFMLPHTANVLNNINDPKIRGITAKSIGNFNEYLNADLPSDPDAAAAEKLKRITAVGVGSGSQELMNNLWSKPGLQDTGPGLQPTLTRPSFPTALGGTPGETVPVGNALIKDIPPTPITGPYGEGGATTTKVLRAGVKGNALTPTVPGPVPAAGGAKTLPVGVGAPFTGPSQEQTAANAGAGIAGGDINKEMIARQESLPNQLKRLDLMSGALEKFQAGGGANFRADLGKALQGLKNVGVGGISDKTIDNVANSSLPDTQLFSAEVKPLVITALKEAAQGTGRVMRSEVDAFLDMMSATTDPNALMGLLNQSRYALQVGYDQAQKFTEFKQALAKKDPAVAGLGPSDFFSWYNKQFNPSQLPNQTGGGVNLGPVAGAKGTVQHPEDIKAILNKFKK